MVRADLVRVVQLLCRFRAKITWPSVYDPFLGPVKGRYWSKNCFAHFSIHSFHFTFIMISIKNMEKKKDFFLRFVSMEMAAIFDFRALTKVHITLIKTASSNAVKSCTHIEDIQMKKRTEAFLFVLHNTFLIIVCVQNTTKI